MNTESIRYAYAIPGHRTQTVYYQKLEIPIADHILMESERPVDGDYIATAAGTWKLVIDNSIYIANGQARQQRIQREQQQKAKADLQKLKQQVAAMAM